MMNQGLKLLDVELDAAITFKADNTLPIVGKTGAYCRRKAITHSRTAGIDQMSLIIFQTHGLYGYHTCRTICTDYHISITKIIRQYITKNIWINLFFDPPIFGKNHRITIVTLTAPGKPF